MRGSRKEKKRREKKRKEKTTPFGVNLMRSQVLYRAAQRLRGIYFNVSPAPEEFLYICA